MDRDPLLSIDHPTKTIANTLAVSEIGVFKNASTLSLVLSGLTSAASGR